jgi:hypothetical protein
MSRVPFLDPDTDRNLLEARVSVWGVECCISILRRGIVCFVSREEEKKNVDKENRGFCDDSLCCEDDDLRNGFRR